VFWKKGESSTESVTLAGGVPQNRRGGEPPPTADRGTSTTSLDACCGRLQRSAQLAPRPVRDGLPCEDTSSSVTCSRDSAHCDASAQQLELRHAVDYCHATLRARDFSSCKSIRCKQLRVSCPETRGCVLWKSLVGVHVASALIHKPQTVNPTARPRVSAPPFSTAILGNDAFLAAAPALPVQLLHAALAAGFDAVVPASLGDELVAGETLRIAQLRGRRPVVQCACPFSLAQLCKREANLADVTIPVAPAPVALARALRQDRAEPQHITYIGACPGAQDQSIDLQILPEAFLRGLDRKGLSPATQPLVFSDRLPPDRRRYLSLPGGAPRPELVEALLRRTVIALSGRMNPLLAVADALFDGGVTMIDPAGAYHCSCAGSDGNRSVAEGRVAIERLEPMRAMSPIFEAPAWLDLRPSEPLDAADSADDDKVATGPVAFRDAARFDQTPGTSDSERGGVPASQTDASRRLYALGVRTARRRSPHASQAVDASSVISEHIPQTTAALHAQPIEREIPLADQTSPFADQLAALTPPAKRAATKFDDLFRRD